jgi:hypothetical protein
LGLGYSNPESGKGLGFRLQALGFRLLSLEYRVPESGKGDDALDADGACLVTRWCGFSSRLCGFSYRV